MVKKILFVFGTRPEAVKLCPVALHMKSRQDVFDVKVCVTGQHREMLDSVLELFDVVPDADLDLMRPDQNLFDLTADIIRSMRPVLEEFQPGWVIVQGDATTAWTAALCAFYHGALVGHVEAGLRTFDKRQPFPEEINRRLCTQLADLHFAPTDQSRANLLAEGTPPERIAITGNTVIDALTWVTGRIATSPTEDVLAVARWCDRTIGGAKMVLITAHRRESFGEGFENICGAIASLSGKYRDVHWVWPVHLNPNVREPVGRMLAGLDNVHLTAPQPYAPFVWLMRRAALILTDSGGIQEEAPSLAKRVLVMRDQTERIEGVLAGYTGVVGTSREGIIAGASEFLDSPDNLTLKVANPYGDGQASRRIADAILAFDE